VNLVINRFSFSSAFWVHISRQQSIEAHLLAIHTVALVGCDLYSGINCKLFHTAIAYAWDDESQSSPFRLGEADQFCEAL
jgi:hypothetical protein